MSSMSRPLDSTATGSGVGGTGCQAEAAWLSLHGWLLLLSTATEDNTTYAFVSLKHAVVHESDPNACRLVITRRPGSWPPLACGDDGWLHLCLLLSDGRFQAMEAPELEIRFARQMDFAVWKRQLAEVCEKADNSGVLNSLSLRLPNLPPKPMEMKLPELVCDEPMGDDLQVPPVPPLPGEEESSPLGSQERAQSGAS